MTLRRAGSIHNYTPTHPQLIGNGPRRSCGKCGKFGAIGGMTLHRVLGYVCVNCGVKK